MPSRRSDHVHWHMLSRVKQTRFHIKITFERQTASTPSEIDYREFLTLLMCMCCAVIL